MTDNRFNTKERDLLSIHEIMKYETGMNLQTFCLALQILKLL